MDTADNNVIQNVRDTFTSSSFIEQFTVTLLNSNLFVNAITKIVGDACKQQQALICSLSSELNEVKAQLIEVKSQINDHEQYGKRKDILIYGIPFKKDENVIDIVVELGKSLGISLSKSDLYAVHRLPPSRKTTDKTKQAIIVGFLRISDRNQFYSGRKKCRGSDLYKNVFINEHLTNFNNKLYMYACTKLDRKSVYTRNGNVYQYITKGD
ncbi:unnamed protein product, partial [Didymodactylos carnosus]